MKEEQLRKKVAEFGKEQEWNHQYELPFGVKTRLKDIESPGYNTNKWQRLLSIFSRMDTDCTRSWIDVGCSDGYYCIEGAKLFSDSTFTGIDLDPLRIERSKFIKEVLEIENVDFKHQDLYSLISEDKKFDVVMGLGLLHRVPDLDKCIEDLLKISRKYIIFEFKSLGSDKPEFIDHMGVTKSNTLNGLYKTPSQSYVTNILEKFGFECKHVENDSSNLNFPRLIVLGETSE